MTRPTPSLAGPLAAAGGMVAFWTVVLCSRRRSRPWRGSFVGDPDATLSPPATQPALPEPSMTDATAPPSAMAPSASPAPAGAQPRGEATPTPAAPWQEPVGPVYGPAPAPAIPPSDPAPPGDVRLSRNFLLSEFLRSGHADLQRVQSAPPTVVVEALRALATTMLQPLREHLGTPVTIQSGWRSPELNRRVGGSTTSQHLLGQAADIHVPGQDLVETWKWLARSGLPFGQLILEGRTPGKPTWIHLSLGPPWRSSTRSGQVMTFDGSTYRTVALV